MTYLEQIQRGVDHIEAHLDEDIALAQVARKAGISQWHFQRVFKALTGETLKTYIRSRRMANALDRLLTTQMRILDIALLAGFSSHEAFTRAFKKAFDLTPQHYRRLGNRSLFLKKAQFDTAYLQHINGQLSLSPEIIERPATTLVGLRTLFYGTGSEKNNLASKLPQLWAQFLPRVSQIEDRTERVCYGLVKQLSADDDQLEYHAAAAVRQIGVLPNGMVRVETPRALYAHFTHRGPAQAIDQTVNYIYSTWLSQSEYRHTYGADLEIYGAEYHPTEPTSVMQYAIPIRRA